jgi:alginate O-acetyltransferase complex protein AlgI
MFKKVVIADRLALMVNQVYANPHDYQGIPLFIAVILFAFQIYCDFSGYSDIALGSAQAMGFKLMTNFNHPFESRNITEFWRRWHISLSTWFNDYLFTPLVVAKRDWGKAGVVFALFITFFLSGLWHGAGWTFIIFGILHGLAIIFEFLTKKTRKKVYTILPNWLYNRTSQLLTFCFACLTWIFFRSLHLKDAWYILTHIFLNIRTQFFEILTNKDYLRLPLLYLNQEKWTLFLSLIGIFILELVQYIQRKKHLHLLELLQSYPVWKRWSFYYFIIFATLAFGVFNKSSFIYFQF